MNRPYEVGTIVRHPKKPEWGLGNVMKIEGNVANVSFKDDVSEDYRKIRTNLIDLERAETQSAPAVSQYPHFASSLEMEWRCSALCSTWDSRIRRT